MSNPFVLGTFWEQFESDCNGDPFPLQSPRALTAQGYHHTLSLCPCPFQLASSTTDHSQDSARPKPRFLSRKQREQMALQKLEQKRAAERQKQHLGNKHNEDFFRAARGLKHHDSAYDSYRGRDSRSIRRSRAPFGGSSSSHHHHPYNHSEGVSHLDGGGGGRLSRGMDRRNSAKLEELQLIKDQYLGKKRAKKMIVPPSQKFKFNFDWETSEDTSEDLNHLYSRRASIAFLFGRGYIAGIDREEQDKRNEMIWKDIRGRKGTHSHSDANGKGKGGGAEDGNFADLGDVDSVIAEKLRLRRLQRMEKEKKNYERDRLDARNWRDKKLEEMTERDWRILKEEFRISTKFGGRLPNPVRFWSESGLPPTILRAIKEVLYCPLFVCCHFASVCQ